MLSKEQILIAVDFNIHVDDTRNVDAVTFLDLLESFGLQQHVKQPTHVLGLTLDLIISRYSDNLLKSALVTDFFVSDHTSLECNLASCISYSAAKVINYRKLRQIDMESFKKDLSKTSLCQCLPDGYFITATEDLNRLVADYNSTLSNLPNHHAPLKSKTITRCSSVPWYTAEMGAAKRLRRKAERKWRRTDLREDLQGCCLTGARSPGAPWLRAWATKVLYKEPERVPNFITKAIDPNFLVNYIPVAGHNTVKVLMYVSTRETCKNSQTIST